jgi:hypothetical protein
MDNGEGSGYLFAHHPNPGGAPRRSRQEGPVNRQEVLNVLVAQLLQQRGLVAAPEQIIKRPDLSSRRMPDVLVDFYGLRLVIESEFDSRNAEDKASNAALERVQEGIAHVGMALVYPEPLRRVSNPDQLRDSLSTEALRFAIVTEAEASTQLTLPFADRQQFTIPFAKGDLNAVAGALRRVYEQLAKDEVLSNAVRLLEEGLALFNMALTPQPAAADRLKDALGIKDLPKSKRGSKTQ